MDFSKYLTFLPVLLGAAVFFVFAFVLWLSGKRALANSRGGIDWVKKYSADRFDLSRQRVSFPGRDKLCLFAVLVYALIFSAGVAFLRSYYTTGSWFQTFYRLKTLCELLFFAAGAVSVCWLLQDLFQDNIIAVCGSILFASSFVGGHLAPALLVISLLLLLRWVTQEDDAALFPSYLWLLAGDILLGMAASRAVGMVWLSLGYLAVHIGKCIRRSRCGSGRGWEVFVTPLISILVWLGAYFASMLGVMLIIGVMRPSNLLTADTAYFLKRLVLRLSELPKTAVTAPIYRGLLLQPLTDAPLLLLGGFGFFTAIRTATDRHEPYALCGALLLGALALCWVLSREYCLQPGLLLCGCCLLRRYTAAEQKAPVVIYTVLGCAYYIVLYLYTYWLQGVASLAEVLV